MEELIGIVFVHIIILTIGTLIGSSKGRTNAGFWWTFFLGVIGWLIIALGPDKKVKCKQCGQDVHSDITLCRNYNNTQTSNPYPYLVNKKQIVVRKSKPTNIPIPVADAVVSCPYCNIHLVISTLHLGNNVCWKCGNIVTVVQS